MKKERQILVVFPHPDDEAFGVSGTLAAHIEQGTPITYACLTLGQMGRNLGNPPFATRESLPNIRKDELVRAMDAIGLTDLRMMGYRDKTLEFEDDHKLTQMVTDLIDELNPSLIISFYPNYSVHPDHEATARAVVRAVRQIPENERPELHCVAFAHNTEEEIGKAEIVYDVSPFWTKKINCLKAHASQTFEMFQKYEDGELDNNPDLLEYWKYERFWPYNWAQDKVK